LLGVKVLDRINNLLENALAPLFRLSTLLLEQVGQLSSLDQFHDHILVGHTFAIV
jgi:hypothetical protein